MAVSKDTVAGYEWGAGCRAWALVDTDTLSIKQELMPAGAAETIHLHRKSRQFFYILEGDATMELEDAVHLVRSGEGLEIPPGKQHRIMNQGTVDLEFLVISEPATRADRVETETEEPGTGKKH